MAQNKDLYTIQGDLLDAATSEPLVGYYVRAYDVDYPDENDYLGEGQSSKKGRFRISYRRTQFVKNTRESFVEGGPDLLLKIYDPQKNLIHTTETRSGAGRFEAYHLPVKLPIRHESTQPIRVSGRLQFQGGLPALTQVQVGLYRQGETRRWPIYMTAVAEDGRFQFSINLIETERRLRQLDAQLYLGILHQGQMVYSTADQVVLRLTPEDHIIDVPIPERVREVIDPKPVNLPNTTIEQLVRAAGVPARQVPQTIAAFRQAGMSELKEFLAKRKQLDPKQVGLDASAIDKMASLAKLNFVTGSLGLSQTLVSKGITSLTQLSRIPEKRLVKLIPANADAAKRLRQARAIARQVSSLATLAMVDRQRSQAPDAAWYSNAARSSGSNDTECPDCQPCDSIFSPLAYLFDLLDFVYYQWGVPSDSLEKLFLQEIDALDCEKGMERVRQIELAIEVLEKYLDLKSAFPVRDPELKESLRQAWLNLLLGGGKRTRPPWPPTFLPIPGGQPRPTGLDELIQLIDETPSLETLRKIYQLLKSKNNRDIARLSAAYRNQTGQFPARLENTYNAILDIYRSALIAATGETTQALQSKLFIKLRLGGCFENNRITQLIQSLQDFILSIRTGEIATVRRNDIPTNELRFADLVTVPVEETGWQWLRDYDTWASAVYALVFTENVLSPPFFAFKDSLPSKDEESENSSINPIEKLVVGRVTLGDAYAAYFEYVFPPSKRDEIRENANEAADWEQGWKALVSAADGQSNGLSLERYLVLIDTIIANLTINTDDGEMPIPYTYRTTTEMDLYFPLLAGWALNHSGGYAAAHDWYRQIYDPQAPEAERFGFDFDAMFSGKLQDQYGDWFTRALDPHSLAAKRKGVYLRHTILMMVRNLLDWADHEYALATPVSLDRARHLYELAERTLNAPDLTNKCDRAIDALALDFVTYLVLEPGFDQGSLQGILDDLNTILDPAIRQATIDDIRVVLDQDPGNIDPIRARVQEAIAADRALRTTTPIGLAFAEGRAAALAMEDELLFPGANGGSPAFFLAPSAPPYLPGGPPDVGGDNGTGAIFEEVPVSHSAKFCVPPNPLLKAYRAYILMSLLKLDLCLNIVGEPLPDSTLSDETVRTFSQGLETELERETLLDDLALGATDQPRYRYSYLVEKARQYADLAQRLGGALLLSYEKLDDERYRKLTADQALDVASETITLRQLATDAARLSLQVTIMQKNRADLQSSWWQDRINNNFMGMSTMEWTGISLMLFSGGLQTLAGAIQGIGAVATGIAAGMAGAAAGTAVTWETGPFAMLGAALGGKIGGAIGIGVGAALPGTAQALGSFAGAASTFGSTALTLAGFERRWEEWNLQNQLALIDQHIAHVQRELASQQTDISNQELAIANLSQTHAQEVLTFLAEGQFSNEALYHWMATILRQNYYTTMQIATTIARMAQRALEFERQQVPKIIGEDYWSIDSDYADQLSDAQKDSGLLGAERLLTDLTRLDAYKLTTDSRRLEISKTISMAQMLPGELIHLRQTGWVSFNTLLDWFDQDYPGHYMRLINNVQVTVVALVPPIHGIHATLRNEGVSTVVVKTSEGFVPKRALRSYPESIALDAAYNDSGLFTLNYNDPMYLPFEGLGVETEWTFALPRANNNFNFETIVDVLLTIQYTARHDLGYESEIRKTQQGEVTADVILDVKNFFPDEWYHFINPAPGTAPDAPRTIEVSLPPQMLPQTMRPNGDNSDNILVQQVSLFVDGRFNVLTALVEKDTVQIEFKDKQISDNLALFTTRTQQMPSPAINGSLAAEGTWKITLDGNLSDSSKTLFDHIYNMVLVITVKGQTHDFSPPWLSTGS